MGSSVSKAEKLQKDKKEELQQLMKVLDSKREQFMAEVTSNRGKAISDKEVNGGRSVVRQSEIRVSSSDAPSKQIKDAIGSFFDAAQGGNKGRSAVVNGATQLVSAGIDAIFGVSAGQGMEKRGFTVLFINFAFVRVDYYVYSYCVTGTKWASTSSVAGSCQVTDLAVLDPATLNPMEIDYLIAQNITIEDDDDNSGQFEALMQIKVMLATNSVLNRIIKSPDTDFETLTKTMEQINGIMRALAGELEKLPAYETDEELMGKKVSDMRKAVKDNGDKTAKTLIEFIKNDLEFSDDVDKWDSLVVTKAKSKENKTKEEVKVLEEEKTLNMMLVKKQKFAAFKRKKNVFKDLDDQQKLGVRKLFGYNEDDYNNYDPDLEAPGTPQMGLLKSDGDFTLDLPASWSSASSV